MYKSFSMELAGKTLTVDVDRVAKQANGAAFMHYGDTVVLSTATASEKPRDGIDFFPLSVEYEEKLYAVVYTSGSTRYMEEAIIEDRTLIIDTTKQRVITSDDISYRMGTFDEVSVIRIDDADKIEQISFPISKVLNKIGSFFEALMNKIGEALTKNAECVPRVE